MKRFRFGAVLRGSAGVLWAVSVLALFGTACPKSNRGGDDEAGDDSAGDDAGDDSAGDDTAGGLCGDSVIQDDFEDCDGENLGGQTCEDQGFGSGDLACDEFCEFDTSGCMDNCLADCPEFPLEIPLSCIAEIEFTLQILLQPNDCEEWKTYCTTLAAAVDYAIEHSSEEVSEESQDRPETIFKLLVNRFIDEIEFPDPSDPLLAPGEAQTLGIETDFPCGEGPNGLTLCAAQPWPGGEAVIVGGVMNEVIPLADPTLSYQIGFVFDADGDPDNNYTSEPPFTNDFFLDTDRWYVANYAPGAGWGMGISSANGTEILGFASAARIVIRGASILAVIPVSEFADPCPAWRVTAFGHMGDFGLSEPHFWSGDTQPPVDMPLFNDACE